MSHGGLLLASCTATALCALSACGATSRAPDVDDAATSTAPDAGDAATSTAPDAGGGLCSPPPTATYSCDPLPSGTPGCSGTPVPYQSRYTVPDPAATFPLGCEILLPFCHPYYPNEVAACRCAAIIGFDAGVPVGWRCPG